MWEGAAALQEHCCVSSSGCVPQSRAATTLLHWLFGRCLWSGAARGGCEDVGMWEYQDVRISGCGDVRMWGCEDASQPEQSHCGTAWARALVLQWSQCCPRLAKGSGAAFPHVPVQSRNGGFGKGKGDLMPIWSCWVSACISFTPSKLKQKASVASRSALPSLFCSKQMSANPALTTVKNITLSADGFIPFALKLSLHCRKGVLLHQDKQSRWKSQWPGEEQRCALHHSVTSWSNFWVGIISVGIGQDLTW